MPRGPFRGLALALVAVVATVHARDVTRLQQPTAVPAGAISGVVVDGITGRPIGGALVRLSRVGGTSGSVAISMDTTDVRGRFVFPNLDASPDYALAASASALGYAFTSYGAGAIVGAIDVTNMTRIALADGQWLSTIKIQLWRLPAISGRVLDERGEPVVGVVVRVFSLQPIAGHPQWVAGPTGVTDDRGAYRIPNLEPGRYAVSVLSVQTTVLDSTPESPQHHAIGELDRDSRYSNDGVLGTPALDVDGRHRLAITYFAAPPPPSAASPAGYPPAFHPSATTLASAELVTLNYGDTKGDVDFQIRPVPVHRVSGRLDTSTARPPAFLLRLMPIGSEMLGPGSEAATTIVERDGSFTFLNVPDGQYTLLAQAGIGDFSNGSYSGTLAAAPGYSPGTVGAASPSGGLRLTYVVRNGSAEPLWGRVSVSVGGSDVDGLVLSLHSTVKLQGRIVFPNSVKTLPTRVTIEAEPADGDPALGQPTVAVTAGDGTFPFTLDGFLGGTYLLHVYAGANLGMFSVTSGGRELIDSGVDASSGSDVTDIVVTMTDKLTRVTGTVHDANGPSAAGVIAFPADRALWSNYGWSPRRIRIGHAGTDGTFTLTGLPEGDYLVVAVDSSQATAWSDERFLAAAAPFATHVSIKWGDRASVTLAVSVVKIK